MLDFYNQPPQGFTRGKDGWLRVSQTPQSVISRKLKKENELLKKRLSDIETIVQKLIKE